MVLLLLACWALLSDTGQYVLQSADIYGCYGHKLCYKSATRYNNANWRPLDRNSRHLFQ